MSMPTPELIANPYPQGLLISFLKMMLRYERVQKQLQELEDCLSRADDAFRDAVFWGGMRRSPRKTQCFQRHPHAWSFAISRAWQPYVASRCRRGSSMSLFRITHVDECHTRRRLKVVAANCRHALRMVEQEFGNAWFACAVKLEGGSA